MKINQGGGPKVLPKAGIQLGVCYSIIELGTQESEFKGEKKKRTEVQISWELPNHLHTFKEELGAQPLSVHATYGLSDAPQSKLPQALQSWGGQETRPKLTTALLKKYLGAPCMVTVELSPPKPDGTRYANVANGGLGVSKRLKEFPVPASYPKNERIFLDLEEFDWNVFAKIPKFLQEKIKKCDEWPSIAKRFPMPAHMNTQSATQGSEHSIEDTDGPTVFTNDAYNNAEDPAF